MQESSVGRRPRSEDRTTAVTRRYRAQNHHNTKKITWRALLSARLSREQSRVKMMIPLWGNHTAHRSSVQPPALAGVGLAIVLFSFRVPNSHPLPSNGCQLNGVKGPIQTNALQNIPPSPPSFPPWDPGLSSPPPLDLGFPSLLQRRSPVPTAPVAPDSCLTRARAVLTQPSESPFSD